MANMNEATKKVHQRLGEVENLLLDILKSMNTAEERAVSRTDSPTAMELAKGRCIAQNARNVVLGIQHDFTHKLSVCTPRKKK